MTRDRATVRPDARPPHAGEAPVRTAGVLLAALVLLAAAGLGVLASRGSGLVAELPPAYQALPLPAGLDSLTSLSEAEARLAGCSDDCATILYLWTPRMPLSRSGIQHVARAADRMGARLTLLAYEELAAYAAGETPHVAEEPAHVAGETAYVAGETAYTAGETAYTAGEPAYVAGETAHAVGASPSTTAAWSSVPASSSLADALLAAGALAHAPSLVVLRGAHAQGTAVLGYKTAAAYEAAVARRLGEAMPPAEPLVARPAGSSGVTEAPLEPLAASPARVARAADYPVVGVPGAYFRWVPGRNAIAYESGQRVYLLDLEDGESRIAPGFIDFVPTPDGRYFVTPGEVEGGLTFYDADEVFEAVERGAPADVEPIFTDLRMRDQYPSVGILERSETRTVYRVLTSWFEGVVYRDYDVRVDPRSGASSVQPVGEVTRPCVGVALSTPIMSQDGREVAGRDEATGTTKIFRILEGGRCEALTDFGVQTTKVAWHASGRRIAFAIPRRRRAGDEAEQGIFVLDRDARDLTRLPTSEGASRLAFPDFVGDDAVVFLVPGTGLQRESYFRVVTLEP